MDQRFRNQADYEQSVLAATMVKFGVVSAIDWPRKICWLRNSTGAASQLRLNCP